MADDLKVKMGIDIDGVLRGMARANKSLGDFKDQAARFKASLDKATDTKSVERLNKAIDASAAKIKAIQSAGSGAGVGFDKVTSSANTAGQSLQNLGRIAQDAPFGFIGIQNNINPLLESFGRLKKETGSAGGALKALAGSLLGAGGLGLAVSVATGLLTVLSQNGFFKSKKAADDSAEANKEFAKSLREVGAEGIATGAKLQGYVSIARNQTLSITQRNEALKQANKIFGEHGEKLTLLNVATAAVTEQINKFTEATIQQALASKFAERAADLIIKQRDASKDYGKEVNKLTTEQSKFNKTFLANSGASESAAARLQQGARSLQDQEKSVAKAAGNYKSITAEVKDISAQLTAAQLAATGLFGELGTKGKDGGKSAKAAKDITTITDVIKELGREIDFLNAKQVAFGTNEAKAKISAIESTAEKLIKDFNVAPDDALINKLFFGGKVFNPVAGVNIPGIKGLKDQLLEPLKLLATQPATEIIVPILPKIELGQIDNEAFFKQLRALNIQEGIEALAVEMQTTISNAFGDAIGAAISGKSVGNIFASFFQQILSTLGAGIQQIGVQTLVAGKAIVTLKKLFGSTAGIGASIGLIALGGIIKGLASKIQIPGFADGVTNFRGGLAMVGERGPELVRLPSGSDVVPNHSLGSVGGGQNMNISGNFRVAGTDLVLVLDRANKSLNRVG